jgi:plasmid stability protein
MAQLTIYIPDDLERVLRKAAEQAHRSLSSLVADILRRDVQPARWPKEFVDALGAWEGPLERPADPPPADVPEW